MDRDNRVHRLLGELIRRMENNERTFKYIDLKVSIHHWFLYPYYKFFDRQFYEVRCLFNILYGDKVISTKIDEFEITLDEVELMAIRDVYYARLYKEQKAWVTTIYISTIGNALATIFLAFLTFTGDQRDTSEHLHKLQKLKQELTLLKQDIQVVMDSLNQKRNQNDSFTTK